MMLNNKQKRKLKAMANRLKAVVMVGKEGMSQSLTDNLDQALDAHELVKVSVLKNAPVTVNEAAIELAASCHAEIVSILGRTIVFYRQSEEKLIDL